MAPRRPTAQKITVTSTSTGASTGVARFGTGMSAASVTHKLTGGTTKAVSFQLQGSIGESGIWTALTAATTASTGGAVKNSTATLTFDACRLILTANDTTGNGVLTAWVLARE